MSAIENLLKTVLKVSGINIEEVKTDVTQRIAAFEANVSTLNNTLISHDQRIARIEKMLEALLQHHSLTVPPEVKPNVDNAGNPLPATPRLAETG